MPCLKFIFLAFSFLTQPQEETSPFLRFLPCVRIFPPHSHSQYQYTFPLLSLFSVLFITVSFPNFCPAISIPLKHPQLFVRPDLKCPVETLNSLPQSHRHIQVFILRPPLVTRVSPYFITISFPNRCPSKFIFLTSINRMN